MSMTQTFFAKKWGKDSLQLIVEMDESSMQINNLITTFPQRLLNYSRHALAAVEDVWQILVDRDVTGEVIVRTNIRERRDAPCRLANTPITRQRASRQPDKPVDSTRDDFDTACIT